MALRTSSLLTAVQLEAENPNGAPAPRIPSPLPRLSFSKPCWVVRTESNVWKEVRKQPDPPCVVCKGSGRADCHHCRGRGRTNFVHLAMLPKGEWPKWCRTCGGSGLSYCSRCVGTGEYRYIMGFHFMKMDANHTQDQKKYEVQGDRVRSSAADLLLNEE
ncbi:hypothetical protein F2P56_031732 [Juglans regia]|uniref:Uncharacterized protein LOC109009225 n=2 Tax=Juglans regia TaxID=51240 RepID=A0A2I4GMN9_JUGRE|nr:uncharacterized protein LOC109009225 [Juglans regia]XP_018845165.1 uncharacterized protein LOC109009225 [Juglans regia]KAF5446073.1 hypothetical protein F2P56_031732 [Juglans regia]